MDPENMLKTVGREQGARHTTGPLIFAVDPLGSLLPHSARLILLLYFHPNPCVRMQEKVTRFGEIEDEVCSILGDASKCTTMLCERNRDVSSALLTPFNFARVVLRGKLRSSNLDAKGQD
jgi:hypothetical protein